MVLETYSMYDLLDEVDLTGSTTSFINPDFQIWKSKEKALLTFMCSTLTSPILALTIICNSAMEVWKVLENRFSSISHSHVINLKG